MSTLKAINIRHPSSNTNNIVVAVDGSANCTGNLNITGVVSVSSLAMTFPTEAASIGFRNIPSIADKTTSYTLQTTDIGKFVNVGSGGSITIPNSTFAAGDVVSLFNNTSSAVTITCTIATAYLSGFDTDKATLTLATRGVATVLFVSPTICVVSGSVT